MGIYIYTYIPVYAETISGRISKKLVLLTASGEKGGIWEIQTWECYFPLLLFFILFDFLPCACMTQYQNTEWVSEVAQLCLTLRDPMDCSLPGSSIHGIFQARVLEWVAISFSRGSSWPRDRTQVSHIADRHFTIWVTSKALIASLRAMGFLIAQLVNNLPAMQETLVWSLGQEALLEKW